MSQTKIVFWLLQWSLLKLKKISSTIWFWELYLPYVRDSWPQASGVPWPQTEHFRAFHSDLSKESFLMGEFTDHNEVSVMKGRLKWHQKEDS